MRVSGSIPACAGEPPAGCPPRPSGPVYPRVCGGTPSPPVTINPCRGLSPRVRGNPERRLVIDLVLRSISACAGEPRRGWGRLRVGRVYPRVCGGTSVMPTGKNRTTGLSPRVRGNRMALRCRTPGAGSIPACAGEPIWHVVAVAVIEVYPRVCGGTRTVWHSSTMTIGLSPRVRGNLIISGPTWAALRSIPACAGEPAPVGWRWPVFQVYPRVCGGTAEVGGASAGSSVYPRVCGGTVPVNELNP